MLRFRGILRATSDKISFFVSLFLVRAFVRVFFFFILFYFIFSFAMVLDRLISFGWKLHDSDGGALMRNRLNVFFVFFFFVFERIAFLQVMRYGENALGFFFLYFLCDTLHCKRGK